MTKEQKIKKIEEAIDETYLAIEELPKREDGVIDEEAGILERKRDILELELAAIHGDKHAERICRTYKKYHNTYFF